MSEILAQVVWDDPDSRADHGIKGQRWGERRYQNSDGTLTEAGKARYRMQEAKGNYKTAHREYSKAFNDAYNYSNRHPISQNFGKHAKVADQKWQNAYDKQDVSMKARSEYKTAKKEFKELSKAERKQLDKDASSAIKKALLVAGTAAAVGTAAYAANKYVKSENMKIAEKKVNAYLTSAANLRDKANMHETARGNASFQRRNIESVMDMMSDAEKRSYGKVINSLRIQEAAEETARDHYSSEANTDYNEAMRIRKNASNASFREAAKNVYKDRSKQRRMAKARAVDTTPNPQYVDKNGRPVSEEELRRRGLI